LTAEADDEGLPLTAGPERAVSEDEARAAADAEQADPGALVRMAEAAPITNRYTNIDQTAIEVTEDRVELVLRDAVVELRKARDWMGPAGLFLGLLLSLVTADFNAVLGFSAEAVKGMDVLATFITGAWTARTGWVAYSLRSTDDTIKRTIERLKHGRPS